MQITKIHREIHQKIQSNQNNNNSTQSNNMTSSSRIYAQNNLCHQNSQPSFQGWRDALAKVARCIKPSCFATEGEAIRALAIKDHGAYQLTRKGYKPISVRKFLALSKKKNVPEIIIKHYPRKPRSGATGSAENLTVREGVSPTCVIDAINKRLKKVTFITDDELHVLTLPKQDLDAVVNDFETQQVYSEFHRAIPFHKRAGELFQLTQEMLDETSAFNHGIKLERFPLTQILGNPASV